jgi:hypothetical protein
VTVRGDEQLRQEREAFDQKKAQSAQWFALRLSMGWAALAIGVWVAVVFGFIILRHAEFPWWVVSTASTGLIAEIAGLPVAVWKLVLSPASIAALEPVTGAAPKP